ncbi:integrase/recombinase XerD [Methanococcus maripaludis]|uniref:Integrase/recombinase XerD n=1 Tax=Methanococcus maripaludis TaxID=39152 RepID=A0A7J9S7S8_METMI|nr:site-specific integrase [Methanococcus maripaludis]MBB6401914.1 integrase/recombinase XerD [Methanococcus maripaludis]
MKLLNKFCLGMWGDGREDSTVSRSLSDLSIFLRFCQLMNKNPLKCKKADFESFFEYLQADRECCKSTRRKYHNMLSVLYQILDSNAYDAYKENAKSRGRFKNCDEVHYSRISEKEYEMILKEMYSRNSFTKYRDCLLIDLLWETGCRKGEILNLKYQDVDFPEKKLNIPKTKIHKARSVPITDDMAKILQDHMDKNKDKGPKCHVFQSTRKPKDPKKGPTSPVSDSHISEIFKRAVDNLREESKISKPLVVIHSLRHSRIVLLLRSGLKVEEVQLIAGHENIETTMGYAHVAEFEDEIHDKMRDQLNNENNSKKTKKSNKKR